MIQSFQNYQSEQKQQNLTIAQLNEKLKYKNQWNMRNSRDKTTDSKITRIKSNS